MSGLARSVRATNRIRQPRRACKPRLNQKPSGLSVVMLIIGVIAGIWVGSHQHDRTPTYVTSQPSHTVTVTVTKTVTVPQAVPFVPSSCTQAVDLMNKMQPLLNRVVSEPNTQADIITRAKDGITRSDPKVLSSAATDENTEHNNMADVEQELQDDWTMLQAAQAQCNKDVHK